MILADKIILLRKKAGWSQEELADQLNVTRQSVSKWEGAQSIPDMDKILMMSKLFGVTTDYLLKDELEEEELISSEPVSEVHRIKLEDASKFLLTMKEVSPKLALGTFLCIISPITLLILAAISEVEKYKLNENAACGIGLIVLIVFVVLGVVNFVSSSTKTKEYEFLENQNFETEYGVIGMAKERKKEYKDTYQRLMTIGVVLCILSVIPLFVAICLDESDLIYSISVGLLLFIVACGVYFLVYGRIYQAALEKLLEEGDYSRKKKAKKGLVSLVTAVFWLATTAIYLFMFLSNFVSNSKSWIIWPIAGVIFPIVIVIIESVEKKERKK